MTYETTAERQIEALHDKVAGLEAMLADAQAEIERLRAALRPFAEAHQECVDNPSIDEPWARPEDFARAAELVQGD